MSHKFSKNVVLMNIILTISVYCDADFINAQIQREIGQKQASNAAKLSELQSIDQKINVLKLNYMQFIKTKINAVDGYRIFFYQNKECEGNDGHLDIVSGVTATISDEICLQAPVNSNDQDFFVAHLGIDDFEQNVDYYQSLFDDQKRFIEDYMDQTLVYTNMYTTSLGPLNSAKNKLSECRSKENQDQKECQAFKKIINFYGKYFAAYNILRTSSIRQFNQDLTDYLKIVQLSIDQTSAKQTQCQAALEPSTALINQRLKAVQEAKNAKNDINKQIRNIMSPVIENILTQNKKYTLIIADLADQLKGFYP